MISREEFLSIVPSLGIASILRDLSEFLLVSYDEAKAIAELDQYDQSLKLSWLQSQPIDERDIRVFYTAHENGYLFSHALADRYYYDKFLSIKPHIVGDVIDYGCGNGSISLLINKLLGTHVSACDLPARHFYFAEFRFKKYHTNISTYITPIIGFAEVPCADTVICLDVLEHITKWQETLCWLRAHARSTIILKVSYEVNPLHVGNDNGLSEQAILDVYKDMQYIKDGELMVFRK